MIYRRGDVWWFSFVFNGERIQKSTRQDKSKQVARDAEAAERMRLVKGHLGIEGKTALPAPTFEAFKTTFMEWVRAEKSNERTQEFYETCYDRLCEFREIAKAKLSEIDEPMIERLKLSLKGSQQDDCQSLPGHIAEGPSVCMPQAEVSGQHSPSLSYTAGRMEQNASANMSLVQAIIRHGWRQPANRCARYPCWRTIAVSVGVSC